MDTFSGRLQILAVQAVPFIMAIVFHEFAHGFVANLWGDQTAKRMGRLTLNPIPHIDPIGTLLFPMVNMLLGINLLFGWAKPVPINPNRFRKLRAGLFWVALAGPGMNFILAVLSAILYCLLTRFLSPNFFFFEPLLVMSYISVTLNYALGIFNLIPLPPLDGSKIVESFLSFEAARRFENLTQYSFFILLGLLWVGAFSLLNIPIQFCSKMTIALAAAFFGLPGAIAL
jgi:Zn-dependent protease